MNILQKVLGKSSIKCNVKIGSNSLSIAIDKETNCRELLLNCLNKCKIIVPNSPRGYNLIEKSNGIERIVLHDENINVIIKSFKEQQVPFEFIIKKCRKSNVIQKSMNRNRKYGHKIFRIVKSVECRNQTFRSDHHYEDIDDELQLENRLANVTRIITSPRRINRSWTRPIVYNLKSIRNIREKIKNKVNFFDQEFFL
ncbi:unnamed protein product [Brachionus calyciflorus]|uniref:Ras-associating domain-containing protein n=1 Tax=Brachionus calyciflorus TaxID=104777 RepID=A0A814B3I0_9BILA|nr:unnamed protein product [Brachionus calyciflorus]